jgi:hypothetical protein
MPTGYTDAIANGITFKDFTMRCARAFGACVELRDSSLDAEIPDEFKVSDYHKKGLDAAEKQLIKVKKMTIAACEVAAKVDYEKSRKSYEDSIKKSIELQHKYYAMLEEVDAWKPPTKDHIELKKFMGDQILQSIKFDCDVTYYQGWLVRLQLRTGAEWKQEQINKCLDDIAYHAIALKEENERIASRNAWVRQLRESLK